uniref:Ig-like domain-containing protein n=1 Tax=Catagonus wagneri TaxID=51154 RepID=A0A8C3W6I0_9CETA
MDVKVLPLLLLLLLCVGEWEAGRGGPRLGDPRYQLQVQELVTVQEGLCVLVPCTVSYPRMGWNDSTPAYGYWMRRGNKPQMDVLVATNYPVKAAQKKRKSPFHLSGDPGANNCSLSIRDARKRDSGSYYFRLVRGAEVKYSYRYSPLTVNVTELKYPRNGTSLLVLEGEPLCLVCVVDSNPPATLSWARRGRTLSPSQPCTPGVLQLPRVESGHEGEFTCRAQHLWGSVHGSLHLSVQSELGGGKTLEDRMLGFVLGAIGGAGIAGLLSLCSCFIFFTPQRPPGSLAFPVILTRLPPFPSAQGYQHEGCPGSPLDQPPPEAANPTSGEEQELHYASLSFHALRPWEPRNLEATRAMEYAEIKIHLEGCCGGREAVVNTRCPTGVKMHCAQGQTSSQGSPCGRRVRLSWTKWGPR